MTEHLIDQHGAKRICYVGTSTTAEFAARYEGYSGAMRDAGLAPQPPLESRPAREHTTIAAISGQLTLGMPDAFLFASDQEAIVALRLFEQLGVSVPRDVKVASFDGILAGLLVSPTLTTVQQPMHAIGRAAVGVIVDALAGRPDIRHVRLPLALRIRQSCGCGGTD
nr:substrate-binding domain-containing protein [Galbitalea soli]